ncbi:hypothetical protein [Streptomyces sp. NPDC101237]|uniref:hypothetical protein n=1 Tax=Streptomyces sp. NPDC101237 TaxID=3366139 RepID=UPI0037F1BDC5
MSRLRLRTTRVGNALLVHPRGHFDERAAGFAEGLSHDPGHTLVVVDLPAGALADEWRTVARLLSSSRYGSLRIVFGRDRGEDVRRAAGLIAERLGRDVLAADGLLVPTVTGGLFAAGDDAAWLRFRAGRPTEPDSRRFPRPHWESSLPTRARAVSARTTAQPVPSGVWLRHTDRALLPGDHRRTVETVPTDPHRLLVVLGSPGTPPLPVDDVARYWDSVRPDARSSVRFHLYGTLDTPESLTPGQCLADALDHEVVLYADLPDGTPAVAGGDGSLAYVPARTAAVLVPPAPGTGEAETREPAADGGGLAARTAAAGVAGGAELTTEHAPAGRAATVRPPVVQQAPPPPRVQMESGSSRLPTGAVREIPAPVGTGAAQETGRALPRAGETPATGADTPAGASVEGPAPTPAPDRAVEPGSESGAERGPGADGESEATRGPETESGSEGGTEAGADAPLPPVVPPAPALDLTPSAPVSLPDEAPAAAPFSSGPGPGTAREPETAPRPTRPAAPRFRLESATPVPEPDPAPEPGPEPDPEPAAAPTTEPAPPAPPPAPSGPAERVRVQPVPASAACAIPPERGVARERDWLRRMFSEQYNATAGAVSRVMSETPGLRGGTRTEAADALTDLVAVRLYLSGDSHGADTAVRTAAPGPHVPLARCVTAGLRRLPSYRGPALLRTRLTDAERAWYHEGRLVTEWAFCHARTSLHPGPRGVGATDVLIWSMTSRRTAQLDPALGDRVLFLPGTVFKVLRSDGDTVLMREVSASEISADGRVDVQQVRLDEIAVKGLGNILDALEKAGTDPAAGSADPPGLVVTPDTGRSGSEEETKP